MKGAVLALVRAIFSSIAVAGVTSVSVRVGWADSVSVAVTWGVALIGTSVSLSATTATALLECTSVLRYRTQLYYHFLYYACINFVLIIQVLLAQTVVAKQPGGIEQECRDIPHPAATITASDMSEMRCYVPPSRSLKRQPSPLSMHSLRDPLGVGSGNPADQQNMAHYLAMEQKKAKSELLSKLDVLETMVEANYRRPGTREILERVQEFLPRLASYRFLVRGKALKWLEGQSLTWVMERGQLLAARTGLLNILTLWWFDWSLGWSSSFFPCSFSS